ncbi:TlpA disulfide reductase family protein [Flavobacterium wongokense]|uniref:TlpA disulfide reductase family protein n=1 Tax=Flavobacterium wongokense TaxID=2910674 RepID=UPI001F3A2D82|nr:TlpA disulfide reductase family protein [Flavobacterium sp. WG47]MCF6132575.1 TlpA family protein disulfide reductase [Flavobacterium sp. WG47]
MKQLLLITFFFVFAQSSQAQDILTFDKFDAFEKAIIKNDGNVYVVNFWATWCGPCVKELPYFEKLHQENKNVKVLLVSLDSPKDAKKLQSFIQKKKITAQVIALFDKDYNSWLDKIDKGWSGSIPATYIFSGDKKLFAEHEFENYAELSSHVNSFTNQLK